MEDIANLGVVGVVSAERLEREVLDEALAQQYEAAGGGDAGGTPQPAADTLARLSAVERELWAVRTAAAAREEANGDTATDAGPSAAADGAATQPQVAAEPSAAPLEVAVMRARAAELERQRDALIAECRAAGVEPPPAPTPAPAGGAAGGAKGSGGGKKRARTGGGATAGGGGAAAGESPASAAAAAAVGPSELVETERDRLIRLGVLTPFDRLEGFERRATTAPAAPRPPRPPAQLPPPARPVGRQTAAAVDSEFAALLAGSSQAAPDNDSSQQQQGGVAGTDGLGDDVARLMAKAARDAAAARAGRATTVLLSPDEVPKQERAVRQVSSIFWQQASGSSRLSKSMPAAGTAAGKRPKRRSTLPRQGRPGSASATERGIAQSIAGSGGSKKRQRRRRRGSSEEEEEWESSGSEGGSSNGDEEEEGGSGLGEGDEEEGTGNGSQQQQQQRQRRQKRSRQRRGRGGNESAERGSEDGEEEEAADEEALYADEDAAGDAAGDYDDVDEGYYTARLERWEMTRPGGGSGGRGAAAAAAAAGPEPGDPPGRRRLRGGGSAAGNGSAALAGDGAGDGPEVKDEEEWGEEEGSPLGSSSGQQRQTAAAAAAAAGGSAAGAAAGGADASADEEPDAEFDGGLLVPGWLWARLFDYQRTAVKWLWELHNQRAGGILGDEMGLGKTIQIIAYLAGLHYSGLWRPTLIVCPATVLRQWLRELRAWYPPLRAMLLHESGRGPPGTVRPPKGEILRRALEASDCSVVLTTYETLRLSRDTMLPVRWGVAVLDEGHKIRNPDADVTLVAKQLRTVHRLVLSGSPIQNRLQEMWSLFDFIFPGKLGTLPVFTAQFAIPITTGGYVNASALQVQAAYRCAVVLRDLIAPYLLRRLKKDVLGDALPEKTEQVLFCGLTSEQRDLYRAYLASTDVADILAGSRNALQGLDILRKICNHPDLLERTVAQGMPDYGNPARSGKLQVVERVLDHWVARGHKALLFCQTQQMLDIIERLVEEKGWRYHRMDGGTPIALRSRLMVDFNTNPDVPLFLLTTKVGGLGVNLTGADRVILYDADWNPATDMQARERAWRIGQQRPVTIYRLICSGTLEEKIYHRQIYKNYLTARVLKDPRQRRFFAAKDMSDLFSLGDEHDPRRPRGGAKSGAGGTAAAGAAFGGGGMGAGPATETARIFQSVVGEELPAGVSAARVVAPAAAADEEETGGSGADAGGSGSPGRRRTARSAGGGGRGRGRGRGSGAGAGGRGAEGGDEATAEDDARVLRELFDGGAGGGIRSLMDHAAIEDANDPAAEQRRRAADAEAARIAQRAADALRASRRACQEADVSVPTWTGRHGRAGAPVGVGSGRFGRVANSRLLRGAAGGAGSGADGSGGEGGGSGATAVRGPGVAGGSLPSPSPSPARPSAAASPSGGGGGGGGTTSAGGPAPPSSAALLARMRERQRAMAAEELAPLAPAAAAAANAGGRGGQGGAARGSGGPASLSGDSGGRGGSGSPAPSSDVADLLVAQIVSFIESAGGAATSELIISHFQGSVPQARMPLFRELLKRVAKLERRPGGQGKAWVLRADFGADGGGGAA